MGLKEDKERLMETVTDRIVRKWMVHHKDTLEQLAEMRAKLVWAMALTVLNLVVIVAIAVKVFW